MPLRILTGKLPKNLGPGRLLKPGCLLINLKKATKSVRRVNFSKESQKSLQN